MIVANAYTDVLQDPRILFIDAYDSFANNIVGLLESSLGAEVILVRIDDEYVSEHLQSILSAFDAVVIGPGPGDPTNPKDVGLIEKLWQLPDESVLPIFGICLGFQSLGCHLGGTIKRLKMPRHGIVTGISHRNTDIFSGLNKFEVTQYHSLYIDIGRQFISETATEDDLWKPIASLQPLAWELDDPINGPTLMAQRHRSKPFWGVQYHPESICTSMEGKRIVANWWKSAQEWSIAANRESNTTSPWLLQLRERFLENEAKAQLQSSGKIPADVLSKLEASAASQIPKLNWAKKSLGTLDTVKLVEKLRENRQEAIFLDAQNHQTSRFSILGLIVPEQTWKLTYDVPSHKLVCETGKNTKIELTLENERQAWTFLRHKLDQHKLPSYAFDLPSASPFWGGWMGYVSYEAGLDSIGIELPASSVGPLPDFNFAFVERSIVIDHLKGHVYIQSLLASDNDWLESTAGLVDVLSTATPISIRTENGQIPDALIKDQTALAYSSTEPPPKPAITKTTESLELDACIKRSTIERPDESAYRSAVLRCQEDLAAGESYELCLTDETRILMPTSTSPWSLYKRLRVNNPAPFGAYMRIGGTTVVGSSPERFLRWGRDGLCQLRPIKGTVRKSAEMTYEKAHAILNTSKERAENLMIVDLIRHDLSGVVGAENTAVVKLMEVEEYQTVYQLVSVIEGHIPRTAFVDAYSESGSNNEGDSGKQQIHGLDVLKASLPPGSMTGAPKKRSCEILTGLERRPRGIYAGVLGYMDVGGGGDFSVVIRTAFRKDDEVVSRSVDGVSEERHVWRVGAGGAVTIQSTDEGEFDEMETKLECVLRTFQA